MAEINRPDLQYQLSVTLKKYDRAVMDGVNTAAAKAMRQLVKLTKEKVPIGRRFVRRKADQGRPHLIESISSRKKRSRMGASVYIWYLKAPNSRIGHLIEHGHWAGKHRQRWVYGSRFLAKSVAEVEPQFETEIKEAIENG